MEKIGNIRIRSEDIGFSAKEMVGCDKCNKQNPPNRSNCLYCGSQLGLQENACDNVKLEFRKPESWEKGFNLVLTNAGAKNIDDVAALPDAVKLSEEFFSVLAGLNVAIPVARTEKLSEAELLVRQLPEPADNFKIISDEDLDADKPPTRIRAIEFADEAVVFVNFNNSERTFINRNDLHLVVFGTVYESKTAVKEKKKRKSSEIIDEAQTVRDESVIDLYNVDNKNGFRLYTSGFDFSCLENDKGLLASENMLRLKDRFKSYFTAAKFVEDHSKVEDILEIIWPSEIRRDLMGFQQSIFAGRSTENQTTVNNQLQFTKFSRLQYLTFNL